MAPTDGGANPTTTHPSSPPHSHRQPKPGQPPGRGQYATPHHTTPTQTHGTNTRTNYSCSQNRARARATHSTNHTLTGLPSTRHSTNTSRHLTSQDTIPGGTNSTTKQCPGNTTPQPTLAADLGMSQYMEPGPATATTADPPATEPTCHTTAHRRAAHTARATGAARRQTRRNASTQLPRHHQSHASETEAATTSTTSGRQRRRTRTTATVGTPTIYTPTKGEHQTSRSVPRHTGVPICSQRNLHRHGEPPTPSGAEAYPRDDHG